ncbi:restriction endonuclease subunit S [Nitrosomonas communis]|uniref:Type I restriction enzyme, S subunit n=1 Tax=Nitrosomonas communis TaxID=44574 RepID=A0A1H2W959_9PROT|nr:restriction endonuclease subunit S [Nitrosomonas communis]SDW76589.1 type I restriction enzyme, S subunit [Nitrosomonas communis]
MAGEWQHTTLGKFVSLQRGHDLTESERKPGAVPVMGSAGQNGFHDAALAKGPGIVIGRSGASFGQVHYCLVDYWPHNTALYVTNFHGNDPQFAYYFLKNINFTRYNSGSAQPSLNRNFIYPIEMNVPQIDEQRAIAHILGTLDDKIELNRRMNETLEAIARAIFKSWFVDFDPVRAKASGEPPDSICCRLGLTPDLLALFPDRLVDSELGEIPEGWEVQTVGEVIDRLSIGKKYEQKTVKAAGKVPVLDQGKSGIIGYHDDEPGVAASIDSPVAVFANHTCYMRLIYFPFSAIQNVLPFVGKGVDTIWAFHAAFGKQSFIEYKGHWPDFLIHKIVVPGMKLANGFSRVVHSLLKMAWEKESESNTLGTLRDTLLPKLLSGELRVPKTVGWADEGSPTPASPQN